MDKEKDNAPEGKKKTPVVSVAQIDSYRSKFLEPGDVGFRKGIFVPRALVDKLKIAVRLLDVEGLTVGVYVSRILLEHLSANADILNALMEKGKKKSRL